MKTPFSILTLVSFLLTAVIGPLPAYAQEDFRLPAPGVMVHLSPKFDPPILKGIKVHPENPFRFDFILDKGDSDLSNDTLKNESGKLIKYFLASLTIPERDLWVNLSPYEKDRIVPKSFGLTEMGRDLLAEDYMLKQITASLIYPEDEMGKKFWKRIYEEAQKKFGTTNIPVNTFNKVWIVPDKAVVFENAKAGTAYVVESKLKVMLEQDYLSMSKHGDTRIQDTGINKLGSDIVREIVIPELTKEVNDNKNFAQLRQVYNSLILATWYKMKIKDSILEQVYANKNKIAGINISDPNEKQRIYERYLQAFKKGVYNYIKEEADPITQETIPRKYFSGGVALDLDGTTNMKATPAMTVTTNEAMVHSNPALTANSVDVQAVFDVFHWENTKLAEGNQAMNGATVSPLQMSKVHELFASQGLNVEQFDPSYSSEPPAPFGFSIMGKYDVTQNDIIDYLQMRLIDPQIEKITNNPRFNIQQYLNSIKEAYLYRKDSPKNRVKIITALNREYRLDQLWVKLTPEDINIKGEIFNKERIMKIEEVLNQRNTSKGNIPDLQGHLNFIRDAYLDLRNRPEETKRIVAELNSELENETPEHMRRHHVVAVSGINPYFWVHLDPQDIDSEGNITSAEKKRAIEDLMNEDKKGEIERLQEAYTDHFRIFFYTAQEGLLRGLRRMEDNPVVKKILQISVEINNRKKALDIIGERLVSVDQNRGITEDRGRLRNIFDTNLNSLSTALQDGERFNWESEEGWLLPSAQLFFAAKYLLDNPNYAMKTEDTMNGPGGQIMRQGIQMPTNYSMMSKRQFFRAMAILTGTAVTIGLPDSTQAGNREFSQQKISHGKRRNVVLVGQMHSDAGAPSEETPGVTKMDDIINKLEHNFSSGTDLDNEYYGKLVDYLLGQKKEIIESLKEDIDVIKKHVAGPNQVKTIAVEYSKEETDIMENDRTPQILELGRIMKERHVPQEKMNGILLYLLGPVYYLKYVDVDFFKFHPFEIEGVDKSNAEKMQIFQIINKINQKIAALADIIQDQGSQAVILNNLNEILTDYSHHPLEESNLNKLAEHDVKLKEWLSSILKLIRKVKDGIDKRSYYIAGKVGRIKGNVLLITGQMHFDLLNGELNKHENNNVIPEPKKDWKERLNKALGTSTPQERTDQFFAEINYNPSLVNAAMKANNNLGGIDLTPANMHLQTQNAGEGIKFHIDPAMLQQLQNAPGFVPVIINIQPMTDLRRFLGL